ncbi:MULTISPECIES: hypothetical protein [Chryseobacterium]|uniref:hypothetical protein n=1 Tax=Chryseobacterium TaxID=59732 RepID=UPI000481B536|nr:MULTISPECIES: hypothetical protein [Chryseobacterium]ATN05134.1 hypothetical protein CRN76_06805 [Chryseobacterium indologenes]AYY86113.1 hypothetical protein EGX91_16945 [Chryseobacterium indologenes]QIX83012.1 hypothetical protein FOB56_17975 [Chryseobacterium indologenes]TLX24626.1 hypothetical protein FE904_16135 [Chryseobacterium indologenes]UDQ52689.1 hypothetical protein LJF28_14750 [Chryseobacterium indologenes]
MGVKIIAAAATLFLSSIVSAQSEGQILKKYSLHKCLANNYKLADPSFNSHDYSASYMFQIKNADYKKLEQLDQYIEKTTSNYYKAATAENLEDGKANYIFWSCMDFYESKGLDGFIKKLTGVARKKKIQGK